MVEVAGTRRDVGKINAQILSRKLRSLAVATGVLYGAVALSGRRICARQADGCQSQAMESRHVTLFTPLHGPQSSKPRPPNGIPMEQQGFLFLRTWPHRTVRQE